MDSRLAEAYNLIDSGKISLLSLDIFDTLLWRKVPEPSDLFLLIGQHFYDHGWLIEAVSPLSFAELRIKAEKLARQKKAKNSQQPTAEVTLKEIYWGLQAVFKKITVEEYARGVKGLLNEADIAELLTIELEFEKKFTEYDLAILQLTQHALSKGIPLILVSDTYFEREQLEFLLSRNPPSPAAGLLSAISYILPSCEFGRGKRRGLLAGICQACNIAPEAILHIGDHKENDFKAACETGMKAVHFPKQTAEYKEIYHRELFNEPIFLDDDDNPDQLMQQRLQKVFPQLDKDSGDFGLTALRSKILFKSPFNKSKDSFFWRYGASIFGPVAAGFTHWIYRRCQEKQQHTVLCLMREGRLYADLIHKYAPYFPQHRLEAKELWISRQYAIRACIRYASPEELYAVLNTNPVEPFTVGAYFTLLGLDVKKIKKYAKYEYVKIADEKFREEITAYLSQQDSLREVIIQSAAAKRERFLRYLGQQVDLSRTTRITCVDVGWIGTTQSAIQVMLQLAGYPITVDGLYLGTSYKSQYGMLQGSVREGFLFNGGYPTDAARVIQSGVHILEQTAIPRLGTLIDFDDAGTPILGKSTVSHTQSKQAQMIQQGMFAFLDLFGQALQSGQIIWSDTSQQARGLLRRILMRAAGFPTKEESRHFKSWQHDWMITQLFSDLTENSILGENSYFKQHAPDMLPQMTTKDFHLIWPPGYAAQTNAYLTLASELVRAKQVPLQCFMSQDSIPIAVYIDTGNGYPQKPVIHQRLHSNANRSFFTFQRLSSIRKPIRKIKIEIDETAHNIHPISLRLTCDRYSNPKSEELVFFEGNVKDRILTIGNKQLFEYTLANCDVYALQLRFAFNTK